MSTPRDERGDAPASAPPILSETSEGAISETSGGTRALPSASTSHISAWITIEHDNSITAYSGKVDLGTGLATALAQIVAEELAVDVARVHMVMGDTARTPNEGYTAGSKSISQSGSALRAAAAEARQALLERASALLHRDIAHLVLADGCITAQDDPTRTLTYAELSDDSLFDRTIPSTASSARSGVHRTVGSSVPRRDLGEKFMGETGFIHNLRLPDMLHARVVRPPSPGATIVSIDATALTDARLVRRGTFLAVVAESEEAAIRGARHLAVEWRETASLPTLDALYAAFLTSPTTDRVVTTSGDVERAWERVVTHRTATYYQPFQAHASIGPSCALADFRDAHLTVWCSSQGIFPLREALADLVQLSQEQIRVIYVAGAGCYGQNGADDVAADAAVLACELQRPVRVQWSREDECIWEPKSPAMMMRVAGGLDQDGHVAAWEYDVWTPSHSTRPRRALDLIAGQLIHEQAAPAPRAFLGGDRNAPTNYVLPHQRVTAHWLSETPLRCSSLRTLGGAPNTFANESFVDELAAAAHAEPLAFRLAHLDDPRARAVLESTALAAHWDVTCPPDEGMGIAFGRYENVEAYVATVAHVRVDRTTGQIRVLRVIVAHDCGLIINPDGVRNQIEGNVIQATSRALKESVGYDSQRVTSTDWESYPILTFSEVPQIEIVLLDRPDQPSVGAGEPATITMAPAIANAVFAATGVRLRRIPFTPAEVLSALAAAANS